MSTAAVPSVAPISKTAVSDDPHNDRDGGVARNFAIISQIPAGSATWQTVNDRIIAALYNTVPHPPETYLGPFCGPEVKIAHNPDPPSLAYRQANGGWNNPHLPLLGRSHMPYARSALATEGLPPLYLPNPALVFDTILKRKQFKPHPGGMCSFIFAYAAIVIHSLFRTSTGEQWRNDASSYLDLSPLYGDNDADLERIRDKSKGRGLLYPDTFSEERLIFMPPAACVLLVLFSRNHNFIAEKILKINERGRWQDPPPKDSALQDEEIFQTARLINCGHFMSTIIGDYVANFVGLSEGTNVTLDPFSPIKTEQLVVERGRGNHVSADFNILYRWHAVLSEQDREWSEKTLSKIFDNKPWNDIGPEELKKLLKALQDKQKEEPRLRTFDELKRGPDGKFNDDHLASILYASIESPAGAFGGLNTPDFLRFIEILGIRQARGWGLGTFNEFREFMGLKRYKSFEEWSNNPEIVRAARHLYGHIDNLEIYTGLVAEDTIPVSPTFAFACPYTMTRGILGDAIALVRGDRFYTTDFTPAHLTTWGFHDVNRDINNGWHGSYIPKLIVRHLPRHFPTNSVYTAYPFMTPNHMKETLTRRGLANRYTFDRPTAAPIPKILRTFAAIDPIMNDPTNFKVRYVTTGYGSIFFFDDEKHDKDHAMLAHALFPNKEALEGYIKWYADFAKKAVDMRSFSYDGTPARYIDVVNQVINAAYINFSASQVLGIPLKTEENPGGPVTEKELFDIYTTIYDNTLEFNLPENKPAWEARTAAGAFKLVGLLSRALIGAAPPPAPEYFAGFAAVGGVPPSFQPPPKPALSFLTPLVDTKRPLDQLTGNAVSVGLGGAPAPSLAAAKVIVFYFDDARANERAHIIKLVKKNDKASDDLLLRYVYEAMRLYPQFPEIWRVVHNDVSVAVKNHDQTTETIAFKKGDLIQADFRTAHLDPNIFREPHKIKLDRDLKVYRWLNGTGFHKCLGVDLAPLTVVQLLKVVFKLKNVRRAPGNAGKLLGFSETHRNITYDWFLQESGEVSKWAGPFVLTYDP